MRFSHHRISRVAGIVIQQLFDPLFITYCSLWWIVHLFRWYQHPIPWINSWLTDLLFVPVAAHIALTFTRCAVLNDITYRYPVKYLLFIALYASLVFEWIVPLLLKKGTADVIDIVAYFTGSLFYYFVHQRMVMRAV